MENIDCCPCEQEAGRGHQHPQKEEGGEGRRMEGEFLPEEEELHLHLEQKLPLGEEFHPYFLMKIT